jgi:DNA ligase-1
MKSISPKLSITDNLEIVPFLYSGYDHNKIWEYLDYAESNDMEGIMVNLDTPYEYKRTKSLIKVKKFYDIDLVCVAVNRGEKGKFKDTLGSITCKYHDCFVNIGSGFSDSLRDYYFNNPDEIVGKIVSVKYKEATVSKDGNKSLQFPVFLCVRDDKTEADA